MRFGGDGTPQASCENMTGCLGIVHDVFFFQMNPACSGMYEVQERWTALNFAPVEF